MKRRIIIASILIITGLSAGLAITYLIPTSGSVTVTGTLESGVEPGCMLLRADNRTQYLLLDWHNYPPPGTRVAVNGSLAKDVASYCMQGNAAIHVVYVYPSQPAASMSIGNATAIITVTHLTSHQPSTLVGVPITIAGYVYTVVESPQCYPECLAPSFMLTYLYVPPSAGCTSSMACYPPPKYYRLLQSNDSFLWPSPLNGTYENVSGILVAPSSWSCNAFYVPRICMSGDIYVENLTYS